MDVNLTDGQAHELELYFLDWSNSSRSEQVQISDATTGMVLDTETVSSFSSGVYLKWTVSGNILIKITGLAGPNPLFDGIFFDSTSVTTTAGSTPKPMVAGLGPTARRATTSSAGR